MKLETIYHLRAIAQIQSFAGSSARLFGAGDKAALELEYAVEEAAGHIIANCPDEESKNSVFEVICKFDENSNMLQLILRNKGLPVDVEHIPKYMIDNPEESIDGLCFFLIKKYTDNFYFRNCGSDGWISVLEKKIDNCTILGGELQGDETASDQQQNAPKGKVTIGFAEPQDAYQITKLAYHTYRYSYAKTVFYYPEMLAEALEHKNVISFAAKDEANEIVAHGAYIRSDRCREIGEIGALMSNPQYRKSMIMMKLIKRISHYPKEGKTDINMFYSKLVTAHTGSQRITRLFNFLPSALFLSAYDRPDFVSMEDKSVGVRESLLYALWIPIKCDIHPVMYTPPKHIDMINIITERLPFPFDVRCDISTDFDDGEINIIVRRDNDRSLATIHINSYFNGWNKCLKEMVRNLSIEGFATIHLEVAAHAPLPEELEDQLQTSGFFFSGVFPDTLEKWMLLYTRFNNQKFDFSLIKLRDDRAAELREYIEQCCHLVEEL